MDDRMFVARFNSGEVEVYDSGTFKLRQRLAVPGLGSRPFDLAVCPVNNTDCLYASDYYNDSVLRVELSGSNAVQG